MKINLRFTSGQSLIELLIAIGLAAIILPALLTAFVTSREGKAQQIQRIDAVNMLKEAEEAVRNVREKGWNNIATNGIYHHVAGAASWSLASGSAMINGYTESIAISDVFRDASGKIVTTGGTTDPSTKQVAITISWNTPYSSSVGSTLYLTRTNNASFTQTTQADFNAGNLTNTQATNTSGGEVVLAPGAHGNWCQPQNYIISTFTLPHQSSSLIAVQGAVYAGGKKAGPQPTLLGLSISDPPYPSTPAAALAGSYSGTKFANGIYTDGHYAYIASNDNTQEISILDVTQNPYALVGTIDIPGNQPSNGIYVSNNIAYVTAGDSLYTYDISTKTGSHTSPLAQASLWAEDKPNETAEQIVVANNHAYITTSNSPYVLQVYSISNNGATLHLSGVFSATWKHTAAGIRVSADGTRTYLAFDNATGTVTNGFVIVDTSPPDPPLWWPYPNYFTIAGNGNGIYSSSPMEPEDVAVAPGNKVILVGNGGSQQYQVIDDSNEANLTQCGGFAISQGIGAVSTVTESDGDVYSYILTNEPNNQFKIIEGGAGGLYGTTGTFESSIFDAGSSVTFNRFWATANIPSSTSITYQVAAANAVAGSCANATYSYVGPDGNTSSYFATPSAIPLSSAGSYLNPARCFRYKAYFSTSDITQTPTLYDVSVNYSP